MQQVEIKVKGIIAENWSEWLGGLKLLANEERGETLLTGQVADTSALYGVLARLRDLGLPLLELKCDDLNKSQDGSLL